MPDHSFRCQEHHLIVRLADLQWTLALVGKNLVFLKHGQNKEEGHLYHVNSRQNCNLLKSESCQKRVIRSRAIPSTIMPLRKRIVTFTSRKPKGDKYLSSCLSGKRQ
jgi:hypothetical protein